MKKTLLTFSLLVWALWAQAQTITKEIIEKCPEMKVGKVYTGKDVRASKKNFPKGIYVQGYGSDKNYPFAKITGKRSVVLFTFDDKYKGEIIYMHAYSYNRKNFKLNNSQSYIFNDGKANRATTYESTIQVNDKKEITIHQKENGKEKIGVYKVGKKRLEFKEWIKD